MQKVNFEEKQIAKDYIPSYDEILLLLDEIESGELEHKCSSEQYIENLTQFIALLAKEGVLPDNSLESLSLDNDIEELLNGEDNLYEDALSFVIPGEYRYMLIPAVLYGNGEVVFCKSWVQKQWKPLKKFAKKHKKALIIGAAVVVAATVVVVAVAAGATAVAAAAAASDNESDKTNQKGDAASTPAIPTDIPPGVAATQEAPTLRAALNDQACSFKENIVQNQFFQSTNPAIYNQGLSWEENGRALGSLLAHDSYNNIQNQIPYHPKLAQEVEDINSKYTFPIPGGYQGLSIAHPEIDRKFSTDYTHLYTNPGQEVDFNTLSHQVRGERALACGYYNQAVQDLGKAIEINPTNPVPYLERGIAHFGLGQYDRSLEDYKQFTAQTPKTHSLSVSEFSYGIAKGLPKGVYESGKGMLVFVAEFVQNPIQTSVQLFDSGTQLVNLARNDQWGVIAEALSPEMHKLVKEWDTLPPKEKGELMGYALGKYGIDFLAPGAVAKLASKSAKSAQELAAICKNIQRAQETLVLETAAEIGNGAQIAKVIQRKTITIAEKLGFNAHEIAQIENIGKIEEGINNIAKNIPSGVQDIKFVNHALQRAFERGGSKESILGALASPLKIEEVRIDHLGRPSQRFIGAKAEVVINPETQQVVSVNPTSTKKIEKLNNELGNVRDRIE